MGLRVVPNALLTPRQRAVHTHTIKTKHASVPLSFKKKKKEVRHNPRRRHSRHTCARTCSPAGVLPGACAASSALSASSSSSAFSQYFAAAMREPAGAEVSARSVHTAAVSCCMPPQRRSHAGIAAGSCRLRHGKWRRGARRKCEQVVKEACSVNDHEWRSCLEPVGLYTAAARLCRQQHAPATEVFLSLFPPTLDAWTQDRACCTSASHSLPRTWAARTTR